jgi:hypothetical protein
MGLIPGGSLAPAHFLEKPKNGSGQFFRDRLATPGVQPNLLRGILTFTP